MPDSYDDVSRCQLLAMQNSGAVQSDPERNVNSRQGQAQARSPTSRATRRDSERDELVVECRLLSV
jgi:hypothetical protein